MSARGARLTTTVIEAIDAGRVVRPDWLPSGPPVPPEAFGPELDLPQVPLSLLRWSAADGGLVTTLGPPTSLHESSEPLREAWGDALAQTFPARCVALPGPARPGWAWYWYLGTADATLDYPVIAVDAESRDEPHVAIWSPGLDVWLAEAVGVLPFTRRHLKSMVTDPVYGPAVAEAAAANFGGQSSLVRRDLMLPPNDPRRVLRGRRTTHDWATSGRVEIHD